MRLCYSRADLFFLAGNGMFFGGYRSVLILMAYLCCFGQLVAAEETGLPELPLSKEFRHVSAGYQHSCAVSTATTLYCWGNNAAAQLGTDDQQDHFSPTATAATSLNWDRVSAGRFHSCAIAAKNGERRLYCWGSNGSGQLGTGDDRSGPKPLEVKGGFTDWLQVTSGISHSCAIRSEGGRNGLYCWGENKAGQAGDPSFNIVRTPRPLTGKQYGWGYVTGGFSHTCAIRDEEGKKKLYCWGANSDGQLGVGVVDRAHPGPVEVSGGFDDWTAVSGGYYHTCGIRDEGGAQKLYCWGNGATGQRGDGGSGRGATPVPLAGDNGSWRALAAGSNHTCAIRDEGADRALYCWGDNRYGQLGVGGEDRSNKPVKIKSVYSDWSQLSAGETHTCAVREKSGRYQTFCWGRNQYGQLGDGTDESRFVPTEVTNEQPKKDNRNGDR